MKKARNSNFSFSLLVAIAVSMSVILYPILMFMINNQDEFWFNITEMLLPVTILTLVVTIFLFALLAIFSGRKGSKIMLLIATIFSSLAICYYIQSNYMVSYLPLLTGDDINWASYGSWSLLSLLLWIGVPVIMLTIYFLRKRLLRTIIYGAGVCLLGMEILVLGMTYISTPINPPEDNAAYFSTKGIHELSEESNVVVMVSDTFQGTFLNEILEMYPEWKGKLADFTYYDNTTGTSCFTYFSFAKLLTGIDFPIGLDSADGMKYAFNNQTLIDTVSNNGYDVAYYSDFKPTPNIQDKVLNYEGTILKPNYQAKQEIIKLLMKSTLFQGAPHHLKKHFIVTTSEYSHIQGTIETNDKFAPYIVNDIAYRESLLSNGLVAHDTNPRYVVYALHGVHSPYSINRNFESVQFSEEETVKERQLEASLASLKLLLEYTEQLKAANLYDQTTIIFTADHGFDLRFYPVMLVKDVNANNSELQINSLPLSHQEDLVPIVDRLTSGKSFADSVNSLNLNKDRIRYALDFRSADGYGKDTDMRSKVQIKGSAADKTSYQVVSDEYSLREPFPEKYILGNTITHADNSSNVAIYGFRSDNQYMYAHSAVMDVWFKDDINAPLKYSSVIQNITTEQQALNIFVGEEKLASLELSAGETIDFATDIPSDLINSSRLTLRFEAPNAIEYRTDSEVLAWTEYHSFRFLDGSIH